MTIRVLVKDQPRSIALVNDQSVLIFRYFFTAQSKDERPKCIVEFARTNDDIETSYQMLSQSECYGCLGIINIENDVYLCTISRRAEVASPRPGETVNRIYGVDFHCLTRPDWDFLALDQSGYAIETAANGYPDSQAPTHEHPCTQLRKLLSNGSFYYSSDFDLTSLLQDRGSEAKRFTVDTIDDSFMWNSYMMGELLKFRSRLPPDERESLDKTGFLTTAIRGFASTTGFRLGNKQAQLTVVSRQSCRRAGTRYNVRGIDDDGNVANFVETETILWSENDLCCGYSQIRGSVPIFWEQDANLISAKINISRSAEATQPAFNKHFENLGQRLGIVVVVNLLADKVGEAELSQRFRDHIATAREAQGMQIGMTNFDFHAEVAKGGFGNASRIIPKLKDAMREFGVYSYDPLSGKDETAQIGIFRTNCLDCLDRTNMVQQIISREALEMFFEYHNINPGGDIWIKHNVLWADNGDQLSQIYAGTGALKTSFTRSGKMGIAGAIADVTKSVGRIYINNFVDKGRQTTMDVLLGRGENQLQVVLHDPINDYVISELNRRRNQFSSTREISLFAGTFNLNGQRSDADLSPWLFAEGACDMYLIGFQEIVELTAGQILNADVAKKEFWQERVGQCLNQRGQYALLRSGQLVGTALFLFVKKEEVSNIKRVEGAVKKTGLGGMAGNKGGVAVSFEVNNTAFCFITAHLAAGLNNVDERHNDYKVLSSGLRFSRGRRIKGHDAVIWLGDFNYRVNLPNEHVRRALQKQDLLTLLEKDQLNRQMEKGATFPYYNEAPITFFPTYKFDNGTDNYDTSEKQRVPAWTDRILSRGSVLKQISYGSAPLMFSDHRPVYATFKATVLVIDDKKKDQLSTQLYDKRRAEVGGTKQLVSLIDIDENMLSHGLPPPSSETKKWWLAGGQPARVGLNPPRDNMVINPNRDVNPFSYQANAKSDFVEKPPLPPRPTSSQVQSPTLVSNSKGFSPPSVPRKPQSLRKAATSPVQSTTLSPRPTPPPLPPRKSRSDSVANSLASSQRSLMDEHPEQEQQQVAGSWTPLQPQ